MEDNTNLKKVSSFPSIGLLFSQSWQTFTQSILSLFILNVLGIAIYIGLAVVAVLVFIISGAGSFLLKNGLHGITTAWPSISGSTITIELVVIAVVFGLVYLIVQSVLQIASILLVDSRGKISLGSVFKKSLGLVIPFFLVNILTAILMFGAAFIFILPAILFYFLLTFVQFEVVLNNQRWLGAIKRSVLLVSHNFGAIFLRLLIILLISIGIVSLSAKLAVISIFINLLLGWYMLAYLVTLYKQARIGLEQEKGKGILWMWLVAILGWLIAAGVLFVGYKTISSGVFNELLKKSQSTTQTQQTTPSPTLVPVLKAAPVISNCIRANIREGEFASNKCYLQQDYEDLQYYLGRYASAKLSLSSAEGFMKIDCGAAQTFEAKKADCEQDQKDKAAAEAEVSKYRGIIQGIIAKGK